MAIETAEMARLERLIIEVSDRLEAQACWDLYNIWHIMANTGCRLSEVTGLLVADVCLDTEIPHIKVQSHAHRSLKHLDDARNMPLIGKALTCTKVALEEAKGEVFLFPAFGKGEKGSNAASRRLMEHIRHVAGKTKITLYDLRQRINTKLIHARVSDYEHSLIFGHLYGVIYEQYAKDSETKRLAVAERALRKALAVE